MRHAHVVVSTGPGKAPSGLGVRVAAGLAMAGFGVKRNWVADDKADKDLVAESKNVQGEDAHEQGCPWLHLELTAAVRVTADTPVPEVLQRRKRLAEALGAAICPAVVLHSENRLDGLLQSLQSGSYDIGQLTVGNDTVMSVSVDTGRIATLFPDAHFAGSELRLADTVIDLKGMNDATSSVVTSVATTSAMRVISPGGLPVLPLPGNVRPSWNATWSDAAILPRKAGDGAVLFYDSQLGCAKIGVPSRTGLFTLVGTVQTGWSTTNSVLVAKPPVAAGGVAGVLCYDPLRGSVKAWKIQGTKLVTAWETTEALCRSWTHVVNVQVGGAPGLLAYDAVEGRAQVYQFGTAKGLSKVGLELDDLPVMSSAVVSGSFGGNPNNDLLFYQPVTGTGTGRGTFYSHDGAGTLKPLGDPHDGWRTTWSAIVPWHLDAYPGPTALLFYEAVAGCARFYVPQGAGAMTPVGGDITGLPTTWRTLTAGTFDDGKHLQLLCHEF